jgi:hypothetical protein
MSWTSIAIITVAFIGDLIFLAYAWLHRKENA